LKEQGEKPCSFDFVKNIDSLVNPVPWGEEPKNEVWKGGYSFVRQLAERAVGPKSASPAKQSVFTLFL